MRRCAMAAALTAAALMAPSNAATFEVAAVVMGVATEVTPEVMAAMAAPSLFPVGLITGYYC
jgi:hypothetical protein